MNIKDAVDELARLGDLDEKDAAPITTVLQNKFGPLVGRFIGKGGKGYAWMVGRDWVFKLTTDEEEAWAASALLGLHHPNVGQYKHVARIDDINLFAIIQEFSGVPIKDVNLQKAINKLAFLNGSQTIAALKDLTEKSSHPLWPQLLSAFQFLRDNGIQNPDLHADNVVQKGDTYKVIDVGVGDPDPMNLGRINLEQKMDIAFSSIEIIHKPYIA